MIIISLFFVVVVAVLFVVNIIYVIVVVAPRAISCINWQLAFLRQRVLINYWQWKRSMHFYYLLNARASKRKHTYTERNVCKISIYVQK